MPAIPYSYAGLLDATLTCRCLQATNYLSTITVQSGKVFAFFAKSPTKLWNTDAKMLKEIQASFRTIARSYARSGPE